jgi:hypothetical protein
MTHSTTKPASGLELLQPLVGKWHTEGQQYEGPLGPASPFVAVEIFEWLDGGHYLVHRLDGHFGRQAAACIEIMGKHPDGELFAQTFYNDGNSNTWQLKENGSSGLVLQGSWSKGSGEAFRVRYTLEVVDAGDTFEGKWEQSRDGESWQTFLEARGTKALPLPNASVGA